MILAFCAVVGCGNGMETSSPEEMVSNALTENEEGTAFYMETVIDTYIDGELTEELYAKEWHFPQEQGSKNRKELTRGDGTTKYIVSDGETSLSYEEGAEEATRNEVIQIEPTNEMTQRLQMLEEYQETHDIEFVGEEEVNGHNTYHLVLETRNEEAINEDMEVWIDQESWFLMKQVQHMGDIRLEFEVLELDTNPDEDEELFALDLPEDVVIVDAADQEFDMDETVEEWSIQDVEEYFGQSVLVLNEEESNVQLSQIEHIQRSFNGTEEEEIIFTYTQNDEPWLEMKVDEAEGNQGNEPEEVEIPGRENHTIRGKEGHSTDMDTLRYITWSEDGLQYNLSSSHPEGTVEDLLYAAEQMELSSD